ncbi:MAG: hypothetical protein ABL958_12690 [Bdellovibrionia bacterium]
MKNVLFALFAFVLFASNAQAYSYKCVCKKGCEGSENFDPDISPAGKIDAVLGDTEYEVAETIHYRPDPNYSPRTRIGFNRYFPHAKEGGIYGAFPVILVEKVLLTGGNQPDAKGNVGTIYARYSIDGKYSEVVYRCQKSRNRNTDD